MQNTTTETNNSAINSVINNSSYYATQLSINDCVEQVLDKEEQVLSWLVETTTEVLTSLVWLGLAGLDAIFSLISDIDTIDTTPPTASITLDDNITDDDVINAQEAGKDINITGTVGDDVKNGDTVTLTINGKEYTGTVADGKFSIAVAGAELANNPDAKIDAKVTTSDDAGNTATATDKETYTVDTTAPTAPTVRIVEVTDSDDGILYDKELTADGKVAVQITINDSTLDDSVPANNAVIGDSLTITNPDGSTEVLAITQDIIDNGITRHYPAPTDGKTLMVKATITDGSGNVSAEATDTAVVDTTVTVTFTKESGANIQANYTDRLGNEVTQTAIESPSGNYTLKLVNWDKNTSNDGASITTTHADGTSKTGSLLYLENLENLDNLDNLENGTLTIDSGADYVFIGNNLVGDVAISTADEDDLIDVDHTFGLNATHQTISTEAGNDRINIGKMVNATDSSNMIDGGTGHDTLSIESAGNTLNEVNLANIETIDLADGDAGNSLTLGSHSAIDEHNIFQLSELVVNGDNKDTVNLTGKYAHWTATSSETNTESNADNGYQQYSMVNVLGDGKEASVLIDSDINVTINQNANSNNNSSDNDKGMFAYKGYSTDEAVALIKEASRLTAFTSEPDNDELKLPDGWKQLTADDLGYSHDLVDSDGFFLVATDKDSQMKVFGEYNDAGELTRINFNIRATNSASDVLEYFKLNSRADIDLYQPLLNAVKAHAEENGLTGSDMLVTGFSLGAAVTNMIAAERENLAGGFFADADYIAFAPPTIHNDPNVILNFGYENDVVHRATGDAESFGDALSGMNSGFRNPDNDYASSIDNLILFNDTYASSAWDLWAFSLANSDSWNAHMEGEYVDTVSRVANSSFYDYTKQDSTVIVADLRDDATRESTWVENIASKRIKPDSAEREAESKTPAFLIGGDKADLLAGGSNFDYIDGGLGDDTIKAGAGVDHIDGNQGTDNLRLVGENKAETTADDWHAFQMADDTLFFVDKDGINLVEADNIELVSFKEGTSHNINELSYQTERVEGSKDNDWLTGQTVFARAGDDVVLGTESADVLHGGRGDDLLSSLGGNDKLYGAEGDDILVGGSGDNTLIGGIGNDTFVIKEISGSDVIVDFNNDVGYADKIIFSSKLFNNQDELTTKTSQDGDNVKVMLDDDNYLTINNCKVDEVLSHAMIVGSITVDAPDHSNDSTPTITGLTDLADRSQVTLTVTDKNGNVQTLETTVTDGQYSVEVTTPLAEGDYSVAVTANDNQGNTVTASDTGNIDAIAPTASITLDKNITDNNTIESHELDVEISITGNVGDDVKEGDTVVLTINNKDIKGKVDADGKFAIKVKGSELAEDNDAKIEARVTITDDAGNSTTATDDTTYVIKAVPFTDNDDVKVVEELDSGITNLKKGADALTVTTVSGDAVINTGTDGDNEDNSIDTVTISEMQGGTINLGAGDILDVSGTMSGGTVNAGSDGSHITIAELTGGTINLGDGASESLKIGKADGGTINFGEGNDTVTITDVLGDGQIDSGFVGTTDGYLSGESFDSIIIESEGNTLSGSQLTSIEKVDLGTGDAGNTLNMTGDEIYNNDGLIVDGDSNDTVNLTKYYDWIKADNAVDGYVEYSYDSWGANETILINADIQVNII